jgi:hypothetical protein
MVTAVIWFSHILNYKYMESQCYPAVFIYEQVLKQESPVLAASGTIGCLQDRLMEPPCNKQPLICTSRRADCRFY